jgi:hypothetical protein
MTDRDLLRKWLLGPPVTGLPALAVAIAAVLLPTLVRGAVDGVVDGFVFATYYPAILLAVMVLDWRLAAATAIAASLVGDLLFMGLPSDLLNSATDLFGVSLFVFYSAMVIYLMRAVRRAVGDPLWLKGPDEEPAEIVFSLERGHACVSWRGERSFVPLGPEREVAAMMEDFLAQLELGKRLSGAER